MLTGVNIFSQSRKEENFSQSKKEAVCHYLAKSMYGKYSL